MKKNKETKETKEMSEKRQKERINKANGEKIKMIKKIIEIKTGLPEGTIDKIIIDNKNKKKHIKNNIVKSKAISAFCYILYYYNSFTTREISKILNYTETNIRYYIRIIHNDPSKIKFAQDVWHEFESISKNVNKENNNTSF